MAIVSVKKRFTGQRAVSDMQSGRRFTEVWVVDTDGRATRALDVQLAPGIPRTGDRHDQDRGVVALNVDPELQANTDRVWFVNVDYGVPQFGEIESPEAEKKKAFAFDPRIPRIQIATVERTKPMDRDSNLKPVINSAGTRLVSVPEVDRSITAVTISARCAFDKFTLDLPDLYRDKLNEKPLLEYYAPGTAKIKNLDAILEDVNVSGTDGVTEIVTLWTVSILIHVQENWEEDILDEGTLKNPGGVTFGGPSPGLNAVSIDYTNLERIVDSNDEDVTEPVLLDGAGNALAAGLPPVYLNFKPYRERDFDALFNQLGLPLTLKGYEYKAFIDQRN